MTSKQRQTIASALNGRTQMDAFEAAKAIWEDPDELLEPYILRILKRGRRPFNRAAAAFAMQIVSSPRTIRALEKTVKQGAESSRVRGEAAEALAHYHRKESHRVLLAGLGDPSKEVRFWCAFALGEMAEKPAVPALKQLVVSDSRVVRGFHSVAKEAADAIQNIQTEKVRHRRRNGCIFCVRA